jgi:glutamyl/glutaminyl-tRNA synthetase
LASVRDAATRDKLKLVAGFAAAIATVQQWAAAPLDEAVKAWLISADIELKDAAQPARAAITERTASPGLFEVLGRERSLAAFAQRPGETRTTHGVVGTQAGTSGTRASANF